MFEYLKEIASELKNKNEKNMFINRINKIANDLASQDVLLIDINEIESIYNPDQVEISVSDETIKKIVI